MSAALALPLTLLLAKRGKFKLGRVYLLRLVVRHEERGLLVMERPDLRGRV